MRKEASIVETMPGGGIIVDVHPGNLLALARYCDSRQRSSEILARQRRKTMDVLDHYAIGLEPNGLNQSATSHLHTVRLTKEFDYI